MTPHRLRNRIFLVLTAGPVVLWLLCIATVIALGSWGGCTIHEGFTNPCIVAGIDLGEQAYTMGLFAAWGPLIFGPFVLGTGVLWAIVALITSIRRRKQ